MTVSALTIIKICRPIQPNCGTAKPRANDRQRSSGVASPNAAAHSADDEAPGFPSAARHGSETSQLGRLQSPTKRTPERTSASASSLPLSPIPNLRDGQPAQRATLECLREFDKLDSP